MRRRILLVAVVGVLAGCGPAGRVGGVAADGGRPLIGLTSAVRDGKVVLPAAYARAVREAGGVPVIVPVLDDEKLLGEYVRRLDGLVLTGGRDIPPAAYGQRPGETVKELSARRWRFESGLAKAWLARGRPLLGVCLGLQVTNVVRGGTLVQDIPSEVGTKVAHRRTGQDAWHAVRIEPDSRLGRILGATEARVASSHHQAAGRIGEGLLVVARSEDGVVEAMEGTQDAWVVLVQWHPERMEEDHRKAVYGALVTACGEDEPSASRPP